MAIFTILIPLVFGMFILSMVLGKKGEDLFFWEKLALSFPIGLGSLVIIMFLLSYINIPLTLLNILLTLTVLIAGITIYLIKNKTFCFNFKELKRAYKTENRGIKWWEYGLIILLALKVVYLYFSSIVKPLIDVDAFQYYTIVAKGVFLKKTFITQYLSNYIHDKPLLPYLSQGWAFISLNSINDALFKIIFPTLFLSLLVIFYSVLRRYYPRRHSLIATFLLSTLPFLVFHVATAYADFTMSFYYGTATIYLFLFMKEFAIQKNRDRAPSYLFISFLLLAFSVWTKRAGIILAGVNIFALLVYLGIKFKEIDFKKQLRKLLIPFVLFLLLILPALIYGQFITILTILKSITGMGGDIAASTGNAAPIPGNKFSIIFDIMVKKLFFYADWHLLAALFTVSILFFFKRIFKSALVFLLGIIILDIIALFVQFSTGEMFRWLLNGTLFDRLMMNNIVVIAYFCAETILPYFTPAKKENS
jgi:hypothetical protein